MAFSLGDGWKGTFGLLPHPASQCSAPLSRVPGEGKFGCSCRLLLLFHDP